MNIAEGRVYLARRGTRLAVRIMDGYVFYSNGGKIRRCKVKTFRRAVREDITDCWIEVANSLWTT